MHARACASEDPQILRARAAARKRSLSSYLRELIHYQASRPELGAGLERSASRAGVEADGEDIRGFIAEGRR